MKTIEGCLVSRDGNLKKCEDAFIVTDNFACVVDGTTSKSRRVWNGRTSGQVASKLITETVSCFEKEIDAETAIQALTESIAEHYLTKGLYEHLHNNPIERFTASTAIYSNYRRELWLVGDIQAIVNGNLISQRIALEDILANARALFLEVELTRGKTIADLIASDSGREFIRPLLEGQSQFQNSDPSHPYFYGVVDGFPVPSQAIKTVPINEDADYIVLASDGYPFLRSTLRESEAILKQVIKEDPLCFRKFKATKGLKKGYVSYDDRTYLKLRP